MRLKPILMRSAAAIFCAEAKALFGDASQRQRILMLAAGVAACIPVVALGMAVGRAVPVKRVVTIQHITTHRTVEKIERVVVPIPPKRSYPPVKNPKDACTGSPAVIVSLTVAGWQGQAKDDKSVNTWLTVRPAGDDFTVQCYMGGDYSESWHVGDLVSMPTGHLAND